MCTWSLRDVRTGDVVGGKSNSHGQHISACRFGPDGSWFVTGGGDGVLRRWAASGSGDSSVAPLTEYSGGHTDGVWSAALSADGSRLLSGGEVRARLAFDLPSVPAAKAPRSLARSRESIPEHHWPSSVPQDSRLVVWDVHTGERLSTIECEDSRRRVAACQFAGAATVVAQLSNGDLSWWDAASGEKTAEVRIEGLDQMVSVCASSVGHSAPPPGGASPTVVGAVVKDDATLRFFASEAGAPTGAVIHLGALEDSSGTVQVFRGVAISPDGSMAVAYGSRRLPNESQTFVRGPAPAHKQLCIATYPTVLIICSLCVLTLTHALPLPHAAGRSSSCVQCENRKGSREPLPRTDDSVGRNASAR